MTATEDKKLCIGDPSDTTTSLQGAATVPTLCEAESRHLSGAMLRFFSAKTRLGEHSFRQVNAPSLKDV